jgi:hypothetical protein
VAEIAGPAWIKRGTARVRVRRVRLASAALVLTIHVPQAYFDLSNIHALTLPSICHVDVAPADIPADPGKIPGKKAPTGIPALCPICVSMHAAGFCLQPGLVAPPPFRRAGAVGFPSRDDVGTAAPYRTAAQARAPPAKA